MGIAKRTTPYYFYISNHAVLLTPNGFIMRQLQSTKLMSAGICTRFFLSATVLLLVLFFTACSKSDMIPDNKIETTPTALLLAGNWKLETWTINPADAQNTDSEDENNVSVQLSACEKDDVMLFKASGEVVMDPKTVCEDDPAQLTTDKWKFINNGTGIVIGTGAEATTYVIVELTATRLKMRETYTAEGTTYLSETVLVH